MIGQWEPESLLCWICELPGHVIDPVWYPESHTLICDRHPEGEVRWERRCASHEDWPEVPEMQIAPSGTAVMLPVSDVVHIPEENFREMYGYYRRWTHIYAIPFHFWEYNTVRGVRWPGRLK